MREFIINQLKTLNVIDEKILIEYVDFCLKRSLDKSEQFKTCNHHILPRAKSLPFKQYSNLNESVWNRSILLYEDHYKAHHLLALAINEHAILNAFTAMHNKDFMNGRISKRIEELKNQNMLDLNVNPINLLQEKLKEW